MLLMDVNPVETHLWIVGTGTAILVSLILLGVTWIVNRIRDGRE